MYFSQIPNVSYDTKPTSYPFSESDRIIVKNFFRRYELNSDVFGYATFYTKYAVNQGVRIETIADRYYGKPTYDWVIILTNNLINPQFSWPLNDYTIRKVAENKYGDDTYSGVKKYSDRLLDIKDNNYFDLFELEKNKENLNLTAGRSVVCVDRKGDGEYGIYVANYGGPTRFYEIENELIKDKAENLNLDNITGGRAVVSGHILTERADIFAANERGANYLFKNNNGIFDEVAFDYRLDDAIQNGRGTALSDIYYRGRLDILSGNWLGYHRAWVLENNEFKDIGNKDFDEPSRIRTIISADFDNDGFDEVFMNNIAEPNKLFRIKDNGKFEQINFNVGLEANGYGTGAAVADIDNDGILELLVSRGESKAQTLTLYKAKVDKGSKYLRIKPLNKYGAPARGATVTLITNQRKHSKTIDAGSGYLCQMEPVAHYGIRKKEKNFKVEIRWTNGSKEMIDIKKLNQTIIVRQK